MLIIKEQCYICGSNLGFINEDDATLLRESTCLACSANIKISDLAKFLVEAALGEFQPLKKVASALRDFRILHAGATGFIHDVLKDLPHYYYSEYFDDLPIGKVRNNIPCEDLQNLTYRDNFFDIVITSEVFEHIEDPVKAFKEIYRVLKVGGFHIFTIPLHSGKKTKGRKGLQKIYHGDPVRKLGSLVVTDWGEDIIDIIDSNCFMITEKKVGHIFHPPEEVTDVDKTFEDYLMLDDLRYYKYNSEVFISKKVRPHEQVLFKLFGNFIQPKITSQNNREAHFISRPLKLIGKPEIRIKLQTLCSLYGIAYPPFAELFIKEGDEFISNHKLKWFLRFEEKILSFSLDNRKFNELRFDPLTERCIITLSYVLLVDEKGQSFEPSILWHNALMVDGKDFYFETCDPQIYFQPPKKDHGWAKIEIGITYKYLGNEVTQFTIPYREKSFAQITSELDRTKIELDQAKNELQQTKDELQQTKDELQQTKNELSKILNSKGYRILQKIRKVYNFLKIWKRFTES